jgi:glyoxylase-like metal-dependent hydrolase (beta-lactamase superfamily II)
LHAKRVFLPPGERARFDQYPGLDAAHLPFLVARSQEAAPDIITTDLGGLMLLQGAGSNVVAMPGDDGALMIDGGLAANADALLRAVLDATRNDRIHTLINTHWHPEQTGANEIVGRAGGVIIAHENIWAWARKTSCNATRSNGTTLNSAIRPTFWTAPIEAC